MKQAFVLGTVLLCAVLFIRCNKDFDSSFSSQPTESLLQSNVTISTAVPSDTMIIDGYALKYSINNTDSLQVFINSKKVAKNCRFIVYTARGTTADYVYADSIVPQQIKNAEPYKNGYGYQCKVTFKFSKLLPSGVYTIAKKIFFVIKNPAKNGEVAVLLHTNTHNAYNTKGGGSLYGTYPSTAVSFQRPWVQDKFAAEFQKWNETPYRFDYYTDVDMDTYSNIENYKLLVILGHSEYWTHEARENLDRFIAAGKNVLVLSGNSIWWQVRYNADKTQMICYKTLVDPVATGLYRTTNFHLLGLSGVQTIGANFTYGGYANKIDSGWNGFKVLAPNNPLFAGTSLAYENIFSCRSSELDGAPTIRPAGYRHPCIDKASLNFYRSELLAYDYGSRNGKQTVGTFIAVQETPTSGVVVNVGNTDWCSYNGMAGPNGATIKLITRNAIMQMYTGKNVFTVN